jgi:hypothetical protein
MMEVRDPWTHLHLLTGTTYYAPVRNLALCPGCKMDVREDNIVREYIDLGRKARPEPLALISMDVLTTMYSCPNCHIILGIAQHTSY